jgi:hypothetical protein
MVIDAMASHSAAASNARGSMVIRAVSTGGVLVMLLGHHGAGSDTVLRGEEGLSWVIAYA